MAVVMLKDETRRSQARARARAKARKGARTLPSSSEHQEDAAFGVSSRAKRVPGGVALYAQQLSLFNLENRCFPGRSPHSHSSLCYLLTGVLDI